MVRTSSGDKFCRFQTAELISPRLWKLSDFIYDEAGTVQYHEVGDIAFGDDLALYEGGFVTYTILVADLFSSALYFKLTSFNRAGVSEDISTVPALSLSLN